MPGNQLCRFAARATVAKRVHQVPTRGGRSTLKGRQMNRVGDHSYDDGKLIKEYRFHFDRRSTAAVNIHYAYDAFDVFRRKVAFLVATLVQ